jgi:hypothetical protein
MIGDIIQGRGFTGVPIYTSDFMVERAQHSRSPARAKRRARLGHPQHFVDRPRRDVLVTADGRMFCHPAVYHQILQEIRARAET